MAGEASCILLRDADQQSLGMVMILRELSEIGHDIAD
jgi:hypothetical protein